MDLLQPFRCLAVTRDGASRGWPSRNHLTEERAPPGPGVLTGPAASLLSKVPPAYLAGVAEATQKCNRLGSYPPPEGRAIRLIGGSHPTHAGWHAQPRPPAGLPLSSAARGRRAPRGAGPRRLEERASASPREYRPNAQRRSDETPACSRLTCGVAMGRAPALVAHRDVRGRVGYRTADQVDYPGASLPSSPWTQTPQQQAGGPSRRLPSIGSSSRRSRPRTSGTRCQSTPGRRWASIRTVGNGGRSPNQPRSSNGGNRRGPSPHRPSRCASHRRRRLPRGAIRPARSAVRSAAAGVG